MKNDFINDYIKKNTLTVLHYDEERPWGAYYVFEETSQYDKKILWLKPHAFLSLQYHGTGIHPGHHEEGEALTDMALILGSENMENIDREDIYKKIPEDIRIIPLSPREKFFTPPGVLHAYINPFDHDVYLTEIRVSQIPEQAIDREKNITRIYDRTMRGGVPTWPKWLEEKISNSLF